MSKVTIKHNQSVLDLSIQTFGTLNGFIELAFVNDISVTDELIEGEELILAKLKNEQTEILNFYNKHQIKPISALSDEDFTYLETDNCNLCYCFK